MHWVPASSAAYQELQIDDYSGKVLDTMVELLGTRA